MKLAFGVWFLWMGAAAMYIAVHGLEATSPWYAFALLMKKMRESDQQPAEVA